MKLWGWMLGNPWVLGGVLAAFTLVSGYGAIQHYRANSAFAARDLLQVQFDAVVASNGTQQTTIDDQSKALDEWAKIGVSPKEVVEMMSAIAQRNVELEKQIAANARAKEKDDAIPECAEVLDLDFERLCPNSAGVLRKSESRLPDQNR